MEQQKFNFKEIDLIGFVTKMLQEKKLLLYFVLVSTILGIIVALNNPKTYTAEVTLAPEVSSGMGVSSNLSDLASMVGIDISSSGGSVDAIYPGIYPYVFTSSNFILGLFDVPVTTKKGNVPKKYADHVIEDATIPFWSYPRIWIGMLLPKGEDDAPASQQNGINPFQLTKKQDNICNIIRKNIACMIDKETNVITIAVSDEDPKVAAIMADTVQNRLQQYIMLYRTKKARNDLDFALKLYEDSKKEYQKAQSKYAASSDAYRNLILESYQVKLEEMENEMQQKFNVYNQVGQQVQMARAKLQERTPAFTIIQDASVPLRASSTPRSFIVITFILLGITADGLWVNFLRSIYVNWRKK